MSSNKVTDEQKKPQHNTDDFQAKRAIEKGKKNARTHDQEPEKITIKLTESDQHKLKKLISRLALSRELIVESAISLFHNNLVKEKKNSLDKLKKQFLIKDDIESKQVTIKLSLSSEAKKKVKELKMEEEVENCAKIAINLYDYAIQTLYNQNTESKNSNQ